MLKLWRYNTTTGYWSLVRICDDQTAAQWLDVFSADEPVAQFKLARKQPKALTGERGYVAF